MYIYTSRPFQEETEASYETSIEEKDRSISTDSESDEGDLSSIFTSMQDRKLSESTKLHDRSEITGSETTQQREETMETADFSIFDKLDSKGRHFFVNRCSRNVDRRRRR